MPENITLENLAEMSQREFEAIRAEMATKQELQEFREEAAQQFDGMHDRFDALAETLKLLREDIKALDVRKDILELRERIERLEKKVGLSQ